MKPGGSRQHSHLIRLEGEKREDIIQIQLLEKVKKGPSNRRERKIHLEWYQ